MQVAYQQEVKGMGSLALSHYIRYTATQWKSKSTKHIDIELQAHT